MSKSFPVFLLILIMGLAVRSQDGNSIKDKGTTNEIIPPSPEASSLGNYGNVPISLYSGKANISIPIWEIKARGFTLPISLSYNSGGIKVDEISSSVGLGWTLNAGGAIVRSVVGRPDEGSVGSNYENYFEAYDKIAKYNVGYNPDCLSPCPNGQFETLEQYYRFRDGVATGQIDTEPDMYFYNFPNHSGKFIMDHKKNVTAVPYAPLDVAVSFGNSLSSGSFWFVTDEFGNRYEFTKNEITTVVDQDGYSNSHISAWYLSKIISYNGVDIINFDYESVRYQPTSSLYSTQWSKHCLTNNNVTDEGGISDPQSITIDQLFIKKITYNRGDVIDFSYEYDRQDVNQIPRISTITVSNVNDNEHSKKFYFDNNTYFKSFDYSIAMEEKRLKLASIRECAIANGQEGCLPPHKFTYNEQVNLPSRFSGKKDHWGYFNNRPTPTRGASEIESSLPKLTNYGGYGKDYPGVDKTPDSRYMDANILRKIQYPTGGNTSFTYAPHSYINTTNPIEPRSLHTSLDGGEDLIDPSNLNFTLVDDLEKSPNYSVTLFTVEESVVGSNNNAQLVLGLSLPTNCEENNNCPPYNKEIFFTALVKADQGNVLPRIAPPENIRFRDQDIFYYEKEIDPSRGSSSEYISLEPGNYLAIIASSKEDTRLSMTISWEKVGNPTNALTSVGGLRIQKTTDNDGKGNTLIKSYQYEKGELFAKPKYTYETNKTVHWPRTYFEEVFAQIQEQQKLTCYKYLNRRSTSQAVLGSISGTHIGYGKVTERSEDKDGNSLGRKEYYYTNARRHIGRSFPYYNKIHSTEYTNGLLTDEKTYNDQGQLLRHTHTDYNELKNEKVSRGLKVQVTESTWDVIYTNEVGGQMTTLRAHPNDIPPSRIEYIEPRFDVADVNYSHTSHWVTKAGTRTALYDPTDGKELTSTTTMLYEDEPTHGQVVETTTVDSKGSEHKAQYLYPIDIADHTHSSMVNNHIIAKLVQQENFVDGTFVGGTKNIYALSGTVLDRVDIAHNDPIEYYARQIFERHDVLTKNPLEMTDVTGERTTYLWGYHYTRPVAKIVNATYAEAVALLGGGVASIQPLDSQSLLDALDKVREGLPNAQVTTYAYDPLIGVTHQTDPNGLTTYYEYDDFGRLESITDHEGNKVQQLNYQYKK